MCILKVSKSDIFTVISLTVFTIGMVGIGIWLSSTPSPSNNGNSMEDPHQLPATTTTSTTTTTTTTLKTIVTESKNRFMFSGDIFSLRKDFMGVSGWSIRVSTFKNMLDDFLSYQSFKMQTGNELFPPVAATGKSMNDFHNLKAEANNAEMFFLHLGIYNESEGLNEKIFTYEQWRRSNSDHTAEQEATKTERLMKWKLLDNEVTNKLRPNLHKGQCANSKEVSRYLAFRKLYLESEKDGSKNDPEFMLGLLQDNVKEMESRRGPEDCYD